MNKVIVAGSRSIQSKSTVYEGIRVAMQAGVVFGEVVTGGARGPDTIAHQAAEKKRVPTKVFEADWEQYGKKAGPIRNTSMAEYADELVAIWDGESRGTLDMIRKARKNGLDVFVYTV